MAEESSSASAHRWSTIWIAWALLVAAQTSTEAVGALDFPPIYGTAWYGERSVFVAACGVFVAYLWRTGSGPKDLLAGAAPALSLAVAMLASPLASRLVFPSVMLIAQVFLAIQVFFWAKSFTGRLQVGASVVALMQLVAVILFAYAQVAIGSEPVPADGPIGAIAYLHGNLADLLPALIGTGLLAWATLRRT